MAGEDVTLPLETHDDYREAIKLLFDEIRQLQARVKELEQQENTSG